MPAKASSFGDRVRRVRQTLGLSQPEFAKRLSISEVTVSRWENCYAEPLSHEVGRFKRLEDSVLGQFGAGSAKHE